MSIADIPDDANLRDEVILDGFRPGFDTWQLEMVFRLPEHEVVAAIDRARQGEYERRHPQKDGN